RAAGSGSRAHQGGGLAIREAAVRLRPLDWYVSRTRGKSRWLGDCGTSGTIDGLAAFVVGCSPIGESSCASWSLFRWLELPFRFPLSREGRRRHSDATSCRRVG